MNWISNVVRPKIRSFLNRREPPENLWIKCPETGQLVFYKDVEANQFVIPGSDYHMRMGATARLKSMFDNETWFDIAIPEVPLDPLKFRDERRYTDRLKDARSKTGTNDAIKLGYGRLDGVPRSTAVSRPLIPASPAAMPSEPPMKSKSCTATTTGSPSSLPRPSLIASLRPVLVRASLRRSA